MQRILLMTAFLMFTLGSQLSFSIPSTTSEVVATIGDKKITLDDFEKRYQEVRSKTLNPPPRTAFLEDLVRYEVGVQEAERLKIANDPIVAERIRQELYKGLIEKELGDKIGKINVSKEEMESYYKKTPELRTSHILIEVKPTATDAERNIAKKRAEEILKEVKASKRPFEELVNLYTDDINTKKSGGDIGWQTPLTVVPSYYEAALKLKVGEVKGLIETKFGFHILKLTGRHSLKEANQQQVRAGVFDVKRKEVFDEYFNKLKAKAKVTVKKSLIES